ncbi:MAG: hypothetical protein AAB466_04345 [Verrucomicrobiota bacterium]
MTRRDFLDRCAAVSATAMFSPGARGALAEEKLKGDWSAMTEDPVRKMFPGPPDLDSILALFPRTTGEPAFDPALITRKVKDLRTNPPIQTGHPFLDLSVRTGLAHIDATFQGDHPKYGVQEYGEKIHAGFPPTIIAAVDALSAWGMHVRAARLFRYWLAHFVRDDGTINYYGPSLSEYGQLLHTAALLEERTGTAGWWQEGFQALDRMAAYLLELRAAAVREDGLISGVPEADTRKETGKYFHNNAWVAKGLERWAELCRRQNGSPSTPITSVRKVAADLARDTLRAIRKTWPADPSDWWLPPRVGPLDPQKPSRLNGAGASELTAYTNYRYWPELLSSGLLPKELANRIVEARLSAAGQFCGMTRFGDGLDDWPLADYLAGVWSLGRKNDFLLSLYGHVAYHQAEGHLTAYEQVSFPPGKKRADYCLPCQLVAARAARLMVK